MHSTIVPEFDTVPQCHLAYLTMRKSGCTSIKSALQLARGDTDCEVDQVHAPHPYLKKPGPEFDSDQWFKFTIVRDPIIRFLSFYGNKVLDQYVVGNPTLNQRSTYGYTPNMLLDDAIDILLNDRFASDPHVTAQSDVLDSVGFELDVVGRLENPQNCLEAIRSATGCQLKLPHHNRRASKYLMLERQQFLRLSEFYARDLERFDYPSDFDQWHAALENVDEFSTEHGFEFVGEAKLLDYSIQRQRRRYQVDLRLRVHKTQSRNLWLQVVSFDEQAPNRRVVHLSMEGPQDLQSECDAQGIVHKRFGIRLEKLPQDVPMEQLFVEIFFWTDELEGASIEDYPGKRIPLAFPV